MDEPLDDEYKKAGPRLLVTLQPETVYRFGDAVAGFDLA
jgi:hypothetical protein